MKSNSGYILLSHKNKFKNKINFFLDSFTFLTQEIEALDPKWC